MKTIYLVRHAKSSWDELGLADIERPLKKRGKKDSAIMGKLLKKKGVKPHLMISSPANRALSTAQIMAEEMGYDKKKIAIEKHLYFEGKEGIMQTIQNLNGDVETVFIFGHNPDFTVLANRFTKKLIDNVPTCGVSGIEFEVKSWKDANTDNGKMIFFDYPSNHR